MTAENALSAALEGLGVPVSRLKHDGGEDQFITYQILTANEDYFSDDDNDAEEWTYRIDIYSRQNYLTLLSEAKKALKSAGFYNIIIDPEMYETDTKYYHLPMEATYMMEVE